MSLQAQIETLFDGKVFERPLFYSYEGGLRFELSDGDHFINQFLSAHHKAMEVCGEVFSGTHKITVCVRIFGGETLLSCLASLRSLRAAGVYPNAEKEYWVEPDEDEGAFWHYIAFTVAPKYLANALWCALSSDFGLIKPNPDVDIYLFNLDEAVAVYPYDDRGMDIVGPNRQCLQMLYDQFNHYLLEYDREVMDAVFDIHVELSQCLLSTEAVFRIFKTYMKPIIEDAFGWDEAFQRHGFESRLQPEWFSWVFVNYDQVGLVCIHEESDRMHLHLLIVLFKKQRQGFGSLITQKLLADAQAKGLPLTMSCFKSNEPAMSLYRQLGFEVVSEDEYFYNLTSPVSSSV